VSRRLVWQTTGSRNSKTLMQGTVPLVFLHLALPFHLRNRNSACVMTLWSFHPMSHVGDECHVKTSVSEEQCLEERALEMTGNQQNTD
jgi:hypothetical protein